MCVRRVCESVCDCSPPLQIGTDHVGMLVHGMFNASVPKGKRLKRVAVDDSVTFEVTGLYDSRGLLALEGRLPSK